jgi:hypothetical protein
VLVVVLGGAFGGLVAGGYESRIAVRRPPVNPVVAGVFIGLILVFGLVWLYLGDQRRRS